MPGLQHLAGSLHGLAARLNTDVAIARGTAHAKFDRIWKTGRLSRSDAYRWLAEQMQLPAEEAHMELFTVEQCQEVVRRVNLAFPEFR